MWSYQRQANLARITLKREITVEEAFAVATRLRNDVGSLPPVRVAIDCTHGEVPKHAAMILVSVLEEVRVAEYVVFSATTENRAAFRRACVATGANVSFFRSAEDWRANARSQGTLRPPDYLADICVGF